MLQEALAEKNYVDTPTDLMLLSSHYLTNASNYLKVTCDDEDDRTAPSALRAKPGAPR